MTRADLEAALAEVQHRLVRYDDRDEGGQAAGKFYAVCLSNGGAQSARTPELLLEKCARYYAELVALGRAEPKPARIEARDTPHREEQQRVVRLAPKAHDPEGVAA